MSGVDGTAGEAAEGTRGAEAGTADAGADAVERAAGGAEGGRDAAAAVGCVASGGFGAAAEGLEAADAGTGRVVHEARHGILDGTAATSDARSTSSRSRASAIDRTVCG